MAYIGHYGFSYNVLNGRFNHFFLVNNILECDRKNEKKIANLRCVLFIPGDQFKLLITALEFSHIQTVSDFNYLILSIDVFYKDVCMRSRRRMCEHKAKCLCTDTATGRIPADASKFLF